MNAKQRRLGAVFASIVAVVILAMALLISLQSSNHPWRVEATATDSSVFIYIGREILRGRMPYRDTFDHKGPLIYLINVLALLIPGRNGLWILELASLAVSFALMYRAARLRCGRLAALIALALAVGPLHIYYSRGNFTETFALPFIALGLYIFLDYFERDRVTRLRLAACGFALGAVCLLRINMAALWIVMCLGVIARCAARKSWSELGRFVLWFTAGLAAAVLPALAWLAANGAMGPFFEDYILFNLRYSAARGSDEAVWGFASVCKAFLLQRVTLLATIMAAYYAVHTRRWLPVLYLSFLGLNLATVAMSGRMYNHYGIVLIPGLVFPLAWLCGDIERLLKGNLLATAMVLAYLVFAFSRPEWTYIFNDAGDMLGGRITDRLDPEALRITEVIDTHAAPGEDIVVCGNTDFFYNASNRFSATKYSYQTPPCLVDESLLRAFLSEMEERQPAVVLLPGDTEIRDEVMAFIDAHDYALVDHSDLYGCDLYARDNGA